MAKKYFATPAEALGQSLQNKDNDEFKITGVIKDVPYNSHFRFDALISRRVYKAPMTPDEAVAIMSAQRGLHFDPDLLDIFLAGIADFCAIAHRYPDEAPTELPAGQRQAA